MPSALRLLTTALHRVGTAIQLCYGSTIWCFAWSCSCRNNQHFTYQLNYSKDRQIPGDYILFDGAQILSTITTLLPPPFFFLWRCGPTRAMASSFFRFLDHTQRRITVGRTPLDEWSVRRRDLYLTTLTTNNHAPGRIRTHYLSRQASVDLRLRPRGNWDRRFFPLHIQNMRQFRCTGQNTSQAPPEQQILCMPPFWRLDSVGLHQWGLM